ncbi:MAG: photosystem reaction center subunit H [Candidatus Aenigmarchaeota archaeon ex4484_224]|nr:MAG: photosystem reaction center subunit H [Candidatus Aenigmarchaeota archaeon ex4484_224]
MPITVQTLNDLVEKDVFTTKGFYCGKVRDVELDLSRFKVKSLVIEIARGTIFDRMLSGKRGMIVPYSMVQAIGDIVIIKHIAMPEVSTEVVEES